MLSKSYRSCTITPQKRGFLIQFPSGNKVLIEDARSFKDCQNWIERQLALLAIQKVYPDK